MRMISGVLAHVPATSNDCLGQITTVAILALETMEANIELWQRKRKYAESLFPGFSGCRRAP